MPVIMGHVTVEACVLTTPRLPLGVRLFIEYKDERTAVEGGNSSF